MTTHISTSSHKQLKNLLALILSSILSIFSFTANATPYIVEMIVFKNNQASNEIWPKDIELHYPNNRLFFSSYNAPSSIASNKNTLPQLDSSEYKLTEMAQKLKSSRNNRILFHKTWKQDIDDKSKAGHLVILGGKTSGKMHELSGSIRLSKKRYLHIETNLWLTEFGYGSATNNGYTQDNNLWPNLPSPFIQTTSSAPWNTNQNGIKRISTLKQKRRMRSNEPHYIDHPTLRAVIEIRKISE